MKKFLSIFLIFVMLLMSINVNVLPVNAASDFIVQNGVLKFYVGNSKVVKIPANVKVIGYEVFANKNIEKIIIPKTVNEIITRAFYNCKYLKTVEWEEGTKIIGLQVFDGCSKLLNIKIPNSVKSCGKSSLLNTAWYNKRKNNDFIINNHILIKYTGDKTSVSIPNKIEVIANSAFQFNYIIKNVKMNDNVKYINDGAFYFCKALEEIELSNNLKIIGDAAFYDCESLINVTLPNSLLLIKNNAFAGTSMKNIVIPKNVKEIGHFAFYDVYTLEEINFLSKNTRVSSQAVASNFLYNKKETWADKFTYQEGDYELINSTIKKYKGKESNIIIPEGITVIGEDAFSYNKNIESVTLPKSLRHIESNAFGGCVNLTKITIKEGLERIDENAFYRCKFEKIVFPSSLRIFTFSSLYGCSSLKTIVFSEGIVDLGESLPFLMKNKKLKDIYIPKSVKYLPLQDEDECIAMVTLHCYKKYDIHMTHGAKPAYKIKIIN